MTTPCNHPRLRSAIEFRLIPGLLALAVSLLLPMPGSAQTLTITNFTSHINVHFYSIPSKTHVLQGAWVYPTNVLRYTNLMWTPLTSFPALPGVNHVFYNDYSVTNRPVTSNRFRIYRVRTT